MPKKEPPKPIADLIYELAAYAATRSYAMSEYNRQRIEELKKEINKYFAKIPI